jgi:plasmid maintenance system antidote protein VapI
MSLNSIVSREIRAELARQNHRRHEIATLLGVTDAHAGRLVNGHRPLTLDQVETVAQFLGVAVVTWLVVAGGES